VKRQNPEREKNQHLARIVSAPRVAKIDSHSLDVEEPGGLTFLGDVSLKIGTLTAHPRYSLTWQNGDTSGISPQ
jgi:hypothetical protein